MSGEKQATEPSPESLAELPEADFTGAIRPNRYANLRGEFRYAVFMDPGLFRHFGSEEKILEALRMLVELADRQAGSFSGSR